MLSEPSSLDTRVLRDRDATGTSNSDPAETWSYASDAVLEERVYYLHDWHQDLVQLIGDDGAAVERVHYSAYGVPFGLHPADLDLDGDVDGSDFSKFSTLYSNGTYDLLADFDHDGDEDSTDYYAFVTLYGVKEDLGRGNLTRSSTDNRIGYAGYQWDRFVSKYHVRNRVYEPTTGRWLNRDPIDYVPGLMNLYEYVGSRPARSVDPFGLAPFDGLFPGDKYLPGRGIVPKELVPPAREPAPSSHCKLWLRSRDDIWLTPGETFRDVEDLKAKLRKARRPAHCDTWTLCISSHSTKYRGKEPYVNPPGSGKNDLQTIFDPFNWRSKEDRELLAQFDSFCAWACFAASSDTVHGFSLQIGDKPVYASENRVFWPYLLPENPEDWDGPLEVIKGGKKKVCIAWEYQWVEDSRSGHRHRVCVKWGWQ